MSSFYCKICQDHQLSKSIYTSHNVKNKNGQISCPTLLNLKCQYCYRSGHTIKYCTKNQKDINKTDEQLKPKLNKIPHKVVVETNISNIFDILMNDDDDDYDYDNDVKQEKKVKILKKKEERSWADTDTDDSDS